MLCMSSCPRAAAVAEEDPQAQSKKAQKKQQKEAEKAAKKAEKQAKLVSGVFCFFLSWCVSHPLPPFTAGKTVLCVLDGHCGSSKVVILQGARGQHSPLFMYSCHFSFVYV